MVKLSCHTHNESPLTGSTLTNMVQRAKDLGRSYFSHTDQGHLGSALKAYGMAKKAGLKPVLGLEFFFKDSACPLVSGSPADRCKYFTSTIYATTQPAYQELCRVISKEDLPSTEIYEEKQHLWNWERLEHLAKFDTLLVLGGPHCMVAKVLLAHNEELAEKVFVKLHGLFGDRLFASIVCAKWGKKYAKIIRIGYKDGTSDAILSTDTVSTDKARKIKAEDLFKRGGHNRIESKVVNMTHFSVGKDILEVTVHKGFLPLPGGDVMLTINRFLHKMAKKYAVSTILSDYAYYASKEDRVVQNLVLGGSTKLYSELHMKTHEEFEEHAMSVMGFDIETTENLISATNSFAAKFDNFELKYEWRLADVGPEPLKQCMEIIQKQGRMKWDDPVYVARLREEINVIARNPVKDFSGYFLPIYDVINHYAENNSLTGPARGSAGGSLMLYLMGITQMDPIKYNLSFPRFLSLDRLKNGDIPDVDSDFPNRDLLVGEDGKSGFLYGRWGDSAAQISTRHTVRLKSAVTDTNRYLHGEVQPEVQAFSKSLPEPPQGVTDKEYIFGYQDTDGNPQLGLIEIYEPLQFYIKKKPEDWKIVQKAIGITRAHSQHACISGDTLVDNNGRVVKLKDATHTTDKPIKVWEVGKKNTVIVSLNNGISIQCTPDHKFITSKGDIEAKDLLGIEVDYKKFTVVSGDFVLDKEMLFALGWGLNDGTFEKSRNNQCFYFTPDKDNTAKEKICNYLKSKNISIWQCKTRKDQLYCGSQNLPDYFFESKKNLVQRLPDYFWSLTLGCQKEFMRGFFSANGFVLNTRKVLGFKIASRLLASDISLWLNAIGIHTNAQYAKPGSAKCYGRIIKSNGNVQITISTFSSRKLFANEIGFIQNYKQNRLMQITSAKHPKDQDNCKSINFKCVAILPSNEEIVYDFNEAKNNTGYIGGILVHNSAFVLSDTPISDVLPVKEGHITQYEAKGCEAAKLIKYDFLVVAGIKDIEVCLKLINKKNNENHKIGYFTHSGPTNYIWDLPYDSEVFRSVWGGDTKTLFQINTPGMGKLVQEMCPDSILDLSTVLALERPGPRDYINEDTGRDMVEEYICRRNGTSQPDLPELFEMIPETYGVIVFQEQSLKISKELGGMEPSEAEKLRRIFSKKLKAEALNMKPVFMSTAVAKVGQEKAEKIWNMMETSSRYSFNASHSTAYALISYAGMYLKHHFALEWWAAILTNAKEKEISGKLWTHVRDIVAAPDINLSTDEMVVDYANGKIRSKLGIIRGMGDKTIDPIVAGRPYKDIQDFVDKDVAGPGLTKKLIHIGVLDSLFPPKSDFIQKLQLFEDAIEVRNYHKKVEKAKAEGKTVKATQPKRGIIDQDFVELEKDPMKSAAAKKAVLPTLLVNLFDLACHHSKYLKPGLEHPSRIVEDPIRRLPSMLLSGEELERMDLASAETRDEDIYVAATGYVIEMKEFQFKNKTRSALKIIADFDLFTRELVVWPDYNTQQLVYPKELKKGSIVTFFLKKRAGKNEPTAVVKLYIEA